MPSCSSARVAVHLGDDERDVRLEPERRRTCRRRPRRPSAHAGRARGSPTCRPRRSRRRSRRRERLGRRLLDDAAPSKLLSRPSARTRSSETSSKPRSASRSSMHAADRAGRADDARPLGMLPLRLGRVELEGAVQRRDRASRRRRGARWQAILIGDVVTTSGSIPCSASVANALAATPGWLFIPAPITLTLPRSSRALHVDAEPVEHLRGCVAVLGRRREDDLAARSGRSCRR